MDLILVIQTVMSDVERFYFGNFLSEANSVMLR